jgi:hypothetical protein
MGVFESSLIMNPITMKLNEAKKKLTPKQLLSKFDTIDGPESFRTAWGKIHIGAGQTLKLQFVVDGTSAFSDKKRPRKNKFEVGFSISPS